MSLFLTLIIPFLLRLSLHIPSLLFLRIRRPPRSTLFPYTFFFLSRRPPRSTLFPYTTLLPSRARLSWRRSEEHTSELQSRLHLVCRLLLEKKKKHLPSKLTNKSRQQLLVSRNHTNQRRDTSNVYNP